MSILNKKEVKNLLKVFEKQFGFSSNLDYLFFKAKDKIYILSKKFGEVDLRGVNVANKGLYFCKIEKSGIRLSIEGSQLIGDRCSKGVYSLNEEEFKKWMTGEDVEANVSEKFLIMKYKEDYLGCGIFAKGEILNFVAKGRRVKAESF